jgi:hypothetical protein
MKWSDLDHKLSIPKKMYLLPMKEEGRKKYLDTLLLIKIGFPTAIHVLLEMIRVLVCNMGVAPFYKIGAVEIILSTFAVISFGIGRYVCSQLRSKFDRYIKYAVRGKDGTGKDAWLNWMCMICSGIVHFMASGVEVEIAGEESILGMVFFYLLPILPMIIMDIVIIKTRWLWTVVDTFTYEENL